MNPEPAKAAIPEPAKAKVDAPSAGATAAPPTAPLTPAKLLSGPSMYETGRVGKMAVSGGQIDKTRSDKGMPREVAVQMAVDPVGRSPVPSAGVVDPAVLGREIKSRFAGLDECRIEFARQKKLVPSTVPENRLTLRWTIQANGQVADTAVVATSHVNLPIMDCVKRRMGTWLFSPPDNGVVRVERTVIIGTAHPATESPPATKTGHHGRRHKRHGKQ